MRKRGPSPYSKPRPHSRVIGKVDSTHYVRVTVWMPEDLEIRLGRYLAEKYRTSWGHKTKVLLTALDRYLTAEGF